MSVREPLPQGEPSPCPTIADLRKCPGQAPHTKRAAALVAIAMTAALLGFAGTGTAQAQTDTDSITLSGTVTAPAGVSTDGVKVLVVGYCGGPCVYNLNDGEYQGEVGESGRWSVLVTRPQGWGNDLSFRSLLSDKTLMVWDENGELATQFLWLYELGDFTELEWLSDIEIQLEAGGRATGRFADPDGGTLPTGTYALAFDGIAYFELVVDPATGEFTSPALSPGKYALAHGNHPENYLPNNNAAQVEVAAGRTTDAGTIQVQRLYEPGTMTGTIADTEGQALSDIQMHGEITSQTSYEYVDGTPFSGGGIGRSDFYAITEHNGTFTAEDLPPGDWKIQAAISIPPQPYTAIAMGGFHSCGIRINQTITCWDNNNNDHGQIEPPAGQYTGVSTHSYHSCAIAADQTLACRGDNNNHYGQVEPPAGQFTSISLGSWSSCGIRTDNTIDCWGGHSDPPAGQFTAISNLDRQSCGIRTDNTIDCWGGGRASEVPGPTWVTVSAQGVAIAEGGTAVCNVVWGETPELACTGGEAEDGPEQTDDGTGGGGAESAAERCFGAHQFGAQPVDVAKTADGQTVLAQVRWGHHPSIGCYLALDTAATAALRAAHT